MLEQVPFMIGGGAEHSAGIARSIAYAATGGKEGVASPGDFRIAAQNVPNGTVRALSGVATLLNTYAGGSGQAYVAKNLSQTHINIQPTGSTGGRSDLIVLSVRDPEFEGEAPSDPNDFDYTRIEVISGVPSSTRNLDGIEFPRPAIPLALINIPANTATITSGMIRDLRFLANPRVERKLFVRALTQADGVHRIRADEKPTWWPLLPSGTQFVDIPEWAQRARITAHVGGVMIPKGGVNAWGRFWVHIGSWTGDGFSTQEVSWDLDAGSQGNQRDAWMTGADVAIPSSLRGAKGRQVGLMTRKIGGNATTDQMPFLDSLSVFTIDVEFYETTV